GTGGFGRALALAPLLGTFTPWCGCLLGGGSGRRGCAGGGATGARRGTIRGEGLEARGLEVELGQGARDRPARFVDHREDQVIGTGLLAPRPARPLGGGIDHPLGMGAQPALFGAGGWATATAA